MIKSIFNKYDDFVYEEIEKIVSQSIVQNQWSPDFLSPYLDFLKNNHLPKLSHWFEYFLTRIEEYDQDLEYFGKHEFEFWDNFVAKIDNYQKLVSDFDAFLDMSPDLKVTFINDNGILIYYRELERVLVQRGHLLWAEQYVSDNYDEYNSDDSRNYSSSVDEFGTDWSNYNDDLDADQQSPDFWNQF